MLTRPASRSGVTIVVNCYNDLEYLPEAIVSALQQTLPADEIIVVDDGSADSPQPIVSRFPGVRLLVQSNAGLAAARNTGLAAVRSEFVLFVDADDRLLPRAIEAGLACLSRHPESAFAFGAYRRIDRHGTPLGDVRYRPVGPVPFADLLRINVISMHATVLYRTPVLRRFRGFDAGLRLCEDYDLYLRIARALPIACHPEPIAEYRWHGKNISRRYRAMLAAVHQVHERYRDPPSDALREAWIDGRNLWTDHYRTELRSDRQAARRAGLHLHVMYLVKEQMMVALRYSFAERLRGTRIGRIGTSIRNRLMPFPPRVGQVKLGDLGTTRPISMDFGHDRGLPIDRYYVEDFLAAHRQDVRGRVLEIGDDAYSRRYGDDRIERQDILHVHAGNPLATLVGELTDPAVVQDDTFDCMVLTQTLHLIYDFQLAVRRVHAGLRPGGVVLLTVPGITPVDRYEWRDTWYWSFHRASVQRLFAEVFGEENIVVESFGNVYAATLFLQGLCVDEARCEQLDVEDAAYPMILAVRARKPA